MVKLSVGWGIRALRFEEKAQLGIAGNIAKECWVEKKQYNWRDSYGEEREKYLNRIGWDREREERVNWNREEMEKEIMERERNRLREVEEEKINKARFNKKYKEIGAVESCPRYLRAESLEGTSKGEEIRALVKLRCGNLENANKYWLDGKLWVCMFCGNGQDSVEHYVSECVKIKEWFRDLGNEVRERIDRLWSEDLDSCKGNVIKRLCKEREKRIKNKGRKGNTEEDRMIALDPEEENNGRSVD